MPHTVAIHDLRVGMYVHLDIGWLAHPFPLSSFRIASPDQIAQLRDLGLQKLRWEPARSDLERMNDADAAPPAAPTPQPTAPAATTATTARAASPQLAAQRTALQLCERQYAEAATALHAAVDAVVGQPAQARASSEALAGALIDKMLVDGDVCIRLLTSAAGDRATAHALNVAVIAMLMGRSFGMARDEMMELGVGALLHDVGKLDVIDRLRHVDEQSSSAEIGAYREHVAAGVRHGRRMGLAPGALLVIGQHHENADGSGFPMKLGTDRMSIGARIVALVNRYDNLCNPAPLSHALTPHEALAMLFAQSRAKYDTTILNAFIRMMGVYPAGSVVQLTDDRHAMVVSVNSSRPLKPRVLVHDPMAARNDGLFVDLQQQPDLGIRRSLSPTRLPPAALDFLAPRPRVSYFFEPAAAAAPPHVAPDRPAAASQAVA